MKLLFKLEFVGIGYGFVLNQYIVQCFESIFQRREICLLLKNSLESLVEKDGKRTVYKMEEHGIREVCNLLRLKHRLHSSLEKSLIERVNQYFKERIENFDDYSPFIRN